MFAEWVQTSEQSGTILQRHFGGEEAGALRGIVIGPQYIVLIRFVFVPFATESHQAQTHHNELHAAAV